MSLKGDKYETAEEVKFRLEGSVVLYDGDPVYISGVQVPDAEDRNEIARVFFQTLPLAGRGLGDQTRKYLSSKKFDLAPFRMGYMNYNGSAVYVSRNPVRQNRQGLTQAVTTFADVRGRRAEDINFNGMLRAQGFVDMVKGKYPSFKEAGELIGNDELSSVAVSRSFAFLIDNDLDALVLMNRGSRCGIAMKGDRSIKLAKKYHFLKEELEECRVPLG